MLELTVNEALAFFASDREIRLKLQPLADVGLDYLRLGQPVPTLSGGEAQRLKLAGFLAQAASQGLTRPVVGRLPARARRSQGHAVHVRRADHRPAFRRRRAAAARAAQADARRTLAAGDRAQPRRDPRGRLGDRPRPRGRRRRRARRRRPAPPTTWSRPQRSHTGRALADYARALGARATTPTSDAMVLGASEPGVGGVASRVRGAPHASDLSIPLQSALRERGRRAIFVHNAREHNLKNIDVEMPRDKFTVITGVSGLGQVDARLRRDLRRRPAPLPRVAQRLRAPVRAAGHAPRRRRRLRHPADGRDRAAHQPRRAQEHGRHAHRDLSLPAPAVRQARHPVLPELRGADRAADRSTRSPRGSLRDYRGPPHRAARAAGGEPQGRVHRPREVGRREGLHAPAGRRQLPAHREVPAHRPLRRARHRAAGRRPGRRRRRRGARCAPRSRAPSNSARAW